METTEALFLSLKKNRLSTFSKTLGSNPYCYWHKSTKMVPSVAQLLFKSGILVQLWACGAKNSANLVQFFYILHSPWHNHWKNHTLFVHTFGVKNSTLSMLSVAYCLKTLPSVAYCRQWECPAWIMPNPGMLNECSLSSFGRVQCTVGNYTQSQKKCTLESCLSFV